MSSFIALKIDVNDELLEEVKSVLDDALQLGGRGIDLEADSGLLGWLPELDSMAVVALISGLEEHFGFVVDDDELGGDIFDTVASLTEFVAEKLGR